jgi:hypothetical protein
MIRTNVGSARRRVVLVVSVSVALGLALAFVQQRTPTESRAVPDRQAAERSVVAPSSPAPAARPQPARVKPAPPVGHQPWQEPTRTELASQIEEIFGSPREEKTRIPFSAEELVDEGLQFKLRNLTSQLALAVDSGVDLRNLEDYGIVVNPDGTVSIDMVAHPRWMGVYEQFASLRGSELPYLMSALEREGLSAGAIGGIGERSREDTERTIRSAVTSRFQAFTDAINSNSLSPEEELQRAQQANYEFNWSVHEASIRWAIGVLAPLDATQRASVLRVVRRGMSAGLSFLPKDNKDGALAMIAAARSGDLMRSLQTTSTKEKP